MQGIKEQKFDQIIDVGPLLAKEEENLIYPEGARDKNRFAWPRFPNIHAFEDYQSYKFCKEGWPYLFKLSRDIYPEQYWIEIFAYQLGCLIGVPVPPTFVAYNSKTEKSGALIEWFYTESDKYKRGGDLLQSKIENYDRKKGKKHNFQSIVKILSELDKFLEKEWINDVIKILTFDALLGNSDRHQENWGVIYHVNHAFQAYDINDVKCSFSPAFDNGTSMGHEISEEKFDVIKKKIDQYILKGRPHMMWNINEDYKNRRNHDAFIKKILEEYPDVHSTMLSCLQFSEGQIRSILDNLLKFNVPQPLSPKRADFMIYLLFYRQKQLLSLLNG